jgi:hypothetical protein
MKREEDKIQQEIFVWYWNNYCLPICTPREIMYHIPNEGKDNGRLVSIGLMPGAADLVFTYRGQHYYCEIKTEKGTQSPNQKKFQKHIEQCGYIYFICRSLLQFQNFIVYLPTGVVTLGYVQR